MATANHTSAHKAPILPLPDHIRIEASLQAIRRRLEAAACAAVIGASAARHEVADLRLFHALSLIGDRLVAELAALDELIQAQQHKAPTVREARHESL
jgi:hypothetical protein